MPTTGERKLASRPERRLSGDERREEILSAAMAAIGAQGFVPVPVEQIARGADVSKALVYAHFPTQAELCNALLARELDAVVRRFGANRARRLEPLAAAWAQAYFDQIAAHGAALHILFTDPHLAGQRRASTLARRDAIFRQLLRAARAYAPLTPRQRIAALAIVLAVIEETGRLTQRGELTPQRGRELCVKLVLSCLRGLRDQAAAGHRETHQR